MRTLFSWPSFGYTPRYDDWMLYIRFSLISLETGIVRMGWTYMNCNQYNFKLYKDF